MEKKGPAKGTTRKEPLPGGDEKKTPILRAEEDLKTGSTVARG